MHDITHVHKALALMALIMRQGLVLFFSFMALQGKEHTERIGMALWIREGDLGSNLFSAIEVVK